MSASRQRPPSSLPPPDREPVILDAAPGPVSLIARAAHERAMNEGWADPTRRYAAGRSARALLDQARAELASGLGVRADELLLFPSPSQARAQAVLGLLRARRRTGNVLLTSMIENSAILQTAQWWTGQGAGATEVGVDRFGMVSAAEFGAAVAAPGIAVAGIQDANPEVGSRQPVTELLAAARAARVPL
ncbi:MAG: aminotransferase class V-fold PLP-dependent enzyme, partial [Angustibacter sp.]